MISDPFEIPEFLRVRPEDQPARRAAWDEYQKNNPPRGFLPEERPLAPDVAKFISELKATEREHARIKCENRDKRKQLGNMVWDPVELKFVYRSQAQMKSAPQPATRPAPAQTATPTVTSRRKPPPDDLPDRLKEFSRDQLEAFARRNGCWDERYAALPNPGLIRMNVINRLRAKVKKGNSISWA